MSKRRKEVVETLVSAVAELMKWDVDSITEDMVGARHFKTDWREVADALAALEKEKG